MACGEGQTLPHLPDANPKSYTGDILCRLSRLLPDFAEEKVETWNVGNEWAAEDDPF
jgi:DNA helicase II / ATP-dependent DNA helicase PcrA